MTQNCFLEILPTIRTPQSCSILDYRNLISVSAAVCFILLWQMREINHRSVSDTCAADTMPVLN